MSGVVQEYLREVGKTAGVLIVLHLYGYWIQSL